MADLGLHSLLRMNPCIRWLTLIFASQWCSVEHVMNLRPMGLMQKWGKRSDSDQVMMAACHEGSEASKVSPKNRCVWAFLCPRGWQPGRRSILGTPGGARGPSQAWLSHIRRPCSFPAVWLELGEHSHRLESGSKTLRRQDLSSEAGLAGLKGACVTGQTSRKIMGNTVLTQWFRQVATGRRHGCFLLVLCGVRLAVQFNCHVCVWEAACLLT